MFGIGTQELLVILLVALLLFGGKRIPEVARSLGSALREVRRAMQDVQREVNEETLKPPTPSGSRPALPAPGAKEPGPSPAAPDEEPRPPDTTPKGGGDAP